MASPNLQALNGWDCTYWPQVTWDFWLGTLCEVASPNLQALDDWDCTIQPQITWDLGFKTLCEVASPNLQAFNGWDCTDWPQVTWWDLGLGTLCEVVSPSLQALIRWVCTNRPQVTLDLGLGTPCKSGPVYGWSYITFAYVESMLSWERDGQTLRRSSTPFTARNRYGSSFSRMPSKKRGK